MEDLLKNKWNLSDEAFELLMSFGINMACLKVIKTEDINEIFSERAMTGQKILFKSGLESWRENNTAVQTSTTPQILLQPAPLKIMIDVATQTNNLPLLRNTVTQMHYPDLGNSFRKMPTLTFDLQSILEKTPKGRLILQTYKQKEKLDKRNQSALTHIIVDFFVTNGALMRVHDMQYCAQAIVNLFPNESLELYAQSVASSGSRGRRGKIYDRYRNIVKSRNKAMRELGTPDYDQPSESDETDSVFVSSINQIDPMQTEETEYKDETQDMIFKQEIDIDALESL